MEEIFSEWAINANWHFRGTWQALAYSWEETVSFITQVKVILELDHLLKLSKMK